MKLSSQPAAAIILAAGLGTRMKSAWPKTLHPILGRPMIAHVAATAEAAGLAPVVVVVGPEMAAVADAVPRHRLAFQDARLGTAHAVLQARDALESFDGTVVVLYGDTPLIRAETVQRLIGLRETTAAGVAVLGFRTASPGAYGRLIVGDDGLQAIVEAKDATAEQRRIDLCNSGVIAVDGARLWRWLNRIDNNNAKGEFYLTDIVAQARSDGYRCVIVEGDEQEFAGVNSRAELAACETIAQERMRQAAMAAGATLIDPATTYFSYDTHLGRDVTVGPFTVFGPGVTIGDTVEIRGFCHLEGCTVAAGAILGPYARLRPGADVHEDVHIGNFVEIKRSVIEAGAKINHLSYIGDAHVGARANIGAGTITCNYDGFAKHRTDIGASAFIGSNSALVAPVKIGGGAIVGAGSVVTSDVPADALVVGRGRQEQRDGWASRFRMRRQSTLPAKT